MNEQLSIPEMNILWDSVSARMSGSDNMEIPETLMQDEAQMMPNAPAPANQPAMLPNAPPPLFDHDAANMPVPQIDPAPCRNRHSSNAPVTAEMHSSVEGRSFEQLIGLLCFEGEMALRYERLSQCRAGRRAACLLTKLCENQHSLVRKMAAAAFLRSGNIPVFGVFERPSGDLLTQLREYALWEEEQAEEYRKLAKDAEHNLRAILLVAQKHKEENAALLARIIEELVLPRDACRPTGRC